MKEQLNCNDKKNDVEIYLYFFLEIGEEHADKLPKHLTYKYMEYMIDN